MASSAMRNILSVLALCEGEVLSLYTQYQNRPNNKTIMQHIERVKSACDFAHKCWAAEYTQRDLELIGRRMKTVEMELYVDKIRVDVPVYSSLCLALVSDLYEHVRDPIKLYALDQINSAMRALHRYYDRHLNKWDDYAMASKAAEKWRSIAA